MVAGEVLSIRVRGLTQTKLSPVGGDSWLFFGHPSGTKLAQIAGSVLLGMNPAGRRSFSQTKFKFVFQKIQ